MSNAFESPDTIKHHFRSFNMDGPEVEYDLSDSEMLDDASEEAWHASPASPLQMADVVNGDTSGNSHCTKPTAFVVDHNLCRPSTGLDRLCGDEERPDSPHVDSPAQLARSSQQDVSKDEVGNQPNILAEIESIFESMVDVLLNERGQLTVAIKTRTLSRGQPCDAVNAAQIHAESVQHLSFPGKTEKEAWRFGERDMRSSLWHRETDTAQPSSPAYWS